MIGSLAFGCSYSTAWTVKSWAESCMYDQKQGYQLVKSPLNQSGGFMALDVTQLNVVIVSMSSNIYQKCFLLKTLSVNDW